MIPILDLKVQYDALRDEIVEALLQVMESGNFILGPDVKALEREVAAVSYTHLDVYKRQIRILVSSLEARSSDIGADPPACRRRDRLRLRGFRTGMRF